MRRFKFDLDLILARPSGDVLDVVLADAGQGGGHERGGGRGARGHAAGGSLASDGEDGGCLGISWGTDWHVDMRGLLLGLRNGAVLNPASLLLALPGRTGLANVDGVTLWTV